MNSLRSINELTFSLFRPPLGVDKAKNTQEILSGTLAHAYSLKQDQQQSFIAEVKRQLEGMQTAQKKPITIKNGLTLDAIATHIRALALENQETMLSNCLSFLKKEKPQPSPQDIEKFLGFLARQDWEKDENPLRTFSLLLSSSNIDQDVFFPMYFSILPSSHLFTFFQQLLIPHLEAMELRGSLETIFPATQKFKALALQEGDYELVLAVRNFEREILFTRKVQMSDSLIPLLGWRQEEFLGKDLKNLIEDLKNSVEEKNLRKIGSLIEFFRNDPDNFSDNPLYHLIVHSCVYHPLAPLLFLEAGCLTNDEELMLLSLNLIEVRGLEKHLEGKDHLCFPFLYYEENHGVTVNLPNKEWLYARAPLLSARSGLCKRMLKKNSFAIDLRPFPRDHFDRALKWIYEGRMEISKENFLLLASCADTFELKGLKRVLKKWLEDHLSKLSLQELSKFKGYLRTLEITDSNLQTWEDKFPDVLQMKKVKKLKLASLPPEKIASLCLGRPHLSSLKILCSDVLMSTLLQLFSSRSIFLRSLEFSFCQFKEKQEKFAWVVESLPDFEKLETLSFSSCTGLSFQDVLPILQKCPNLSQLNLKGMPLDSADLEWLGKTFPHLTLFNCSHPTLKTLSSFKKLREIDLSIFRNNSPQDLAPTIKDHPETEVLNLKGHRFKNNDLLHCVKFLPKLKELNVEGCSELSDPILQGLRFYCPQLKVIHASGTKITEEALTHFHNEELPKKPLRLSPPPRTPLGPEVFEPSQCKDFPLDCLVSTCKALPILRVLNLSGMEVTDAQCTQICQGTPTLKHLFLNYCPKISDQILATLPEGLEVLEAKGTNIAEFALRRIVAYREPSMFPKSLLEPEIFASPSFQIFEPNRYQLFPLDSLVDTCKNFPNLRILNLSGMKVSDSQCMAICRDHPNLRQLFLNNCPEISIQILKELPPDLDVLEAQGTQIPEASLRGIKAYRAPQSLPPRPLLLARESPPEEQERDP